jgi:hypothetical protein
MATPTTTPDLTTDSLAYRNDGHRRTAAETKASFKTTEFFVYLAAVAGVLIASLVVDKNQDGQGFGADHAWFYVSLLTIGYLISRGLAKSGSRHYEDNDR